MGVILGSDRLLESSLLEGHRVGLVSNPASVGHAGASSASPALRGHTLWQS